MRIIDTLAKDFRVIALDCRGHGKSDKPHDATKYGNEMIEDVARLMDHLNIPKAHIVGYSMGGAITGKFITMHPDRVLTAVFGGSVPRLTVAQVRGLKMPMLAVIGSADPIKVGVDAFMTVLPAMKVVVIDGATHSGVRGTPGRPEFVAAVHDFLAAHRSTTSQ